MLQKFYVIKGMYSEKYWNENQQRFIGFNIATRYNNTVDGGKLSLALSDALNVEESTIVEFFAKK